MFPFTGLSMTVLWAAVLIICLAIEAATAGLTTIWFAAGALAALVTALCKGPVWLQIVWFFVISIACLVLTRPLALKYVNRKTIPTNADRAIGSEGLVKERIDNMSGTGAVFADGKIWTARSEDGMIIEPGAEVRVMRMEGVTLYVSPAGKSGAAGHA